MKNPAEKKASCEKSKHPPSLGHHRAWWEGERREHSPKGHQHPASSQEDRSEQMEEVIPCSLFIDDRRTKEIRGHRVTSSFSEESIHTVTRLPSTRPKLTFPFSEGSRKKAEGKLKEVCMCVWGGITKKPELIM